MSDFNSGKKKSYSTPLEALRDLSKGSADTVKKETLDKFPNAFKSQLFGIQEKNFSGEIMPGEALEIKEVYTGKREKEEHLEKQLMMEKRLRVEDKQMVERKTNELRIRIQSIREELLRLVEVTPELTQEVEIASFQATSDPSSYEMFFLERLFEFVRGFRKKIEDANTWLAAANKRARRRNVWGQNYKKHGAKYLLSGEHYASRSAA